MRKFNKHLEATNQGYAGLLRCLETVDKLVKTVDEDEKVIGWDKVVRSGPVRTGLEVLTSTIFQELGFIEEDHAKEKKKP